MTNKIFLLIISVLHTLFVSAQFYSRSERSTTVNGVTTTIITETTPDGKTKTTKKVTNAAGASKQAPPPMQNGSNTHSAPSSSGSPVPAPSGRSNGLTPSHVTPTGSSRDLSVELEFSKPDVYELEPVLMSYKVYTRFPEIQLQSQLPSMNGFVVKELPRNVHLTLVPTTHKGQMCLQTTCGQLILFAQKTGRLTIPSVPFEAQVQVPLSDPFNPFYRTETRSVATPEYTINVKPLPSKPVGFSGAVGRDYTVSAKMLTAKPRANETMSLQVTLHGVGNVDLVSPPELNLPDNISVYSTKTTPQTTLTTQGMEGDLIITYHLVASKKGRYQIPPVELIYFNTSEGQFRSVKSENELTIDVAQGTPNPYLSEQQLSNDDIHTIYEGDLAATSKTSFWMSWWYILIYIIAIILFVLTLKYGDRRITNKIWPLKKVGKSDAFEELRSKLEARNSSEFYLCLMKTLQRIVAKRVNVNASTVTSSSLPSLLEKQTTDHEIVKNLQSLLSECEYHIYGNTNATEQEMRQALERVMEVAKMKKNTQREIKMKHIPAIALAICMIFSNSAHASNTGAELKARADSLYTVKAYAAACDIYMDLLKTYPDNDKLWYNIGNCQYRLNRNPQAILAYERAAKINPANADVRHNLALAKAKTQDVMFSASDLYLLPILNTIVNTLSADGWASLSVVMLMIMLLLAIVMKRSHTISKKKWAFSGIVATVVIIVLANIFAIIQSSKIKDTSHAIVIAPSPLMSTPDTISTNHTTLAAGTKVNILDTTLRNWTEVMLPDGKRGWIKSAEIEKI